MARTYAEVLDECEALHVAKDHDYADGQPYANFFASRRYGERPDHAIMTRLSDKFNRLCSLVAMEKRNEEAHVNETMDDTLRDIVNYAAIMLVVRDMLSEEESPR
jgi:hypothetical protein